jgi:hypothetical protein
VLPFGVHGRSLLVKDDPDDRRMAGISMIEPGPGGGHERRAMSVRGASQLRSEGPGIEDRVANEDGGVSDDGVVHRRGASDEEPRHDQGQTQSPSHELGWADARPAMTRLIRRVKAAVMAINTRSGNPTIPTQIPSVATA